MGLTGLLGFGASRVRKRNLCEDPCSRRFPTAPPPIALSARELSGAKGFQDDRDVPARPERHRSRNRV